MSDWTHFRRFYNYKITSKQVRLVRQHSQSLLSASSVNENHTQHPHPQHSHRRNASDSTHNSSNSAHSVPSYDNTRYPLVAETQARKTARHVRSVSFSSFQSTITHGGHDCNGFALDSSRIRKPSEDEVRSVTSMADFDETYTRRALGFNSVEDLYRWVSCVKLLHEIKELPILITNALDDPLVLKQCHEIPEKYTGKSTVHIYFILLWHRSWHSWYNTMQC